MQLNNLLVYLLLAVLFAPLLVALAVRWCSPKAARAVAVYGSVLHLLITASLVVLNTGYIGFDKHSNHSFEPQCVPGDTGVAGIEGTNTNRTSWNLLTLAPPNAAFDFRSAPPAIQFFIGLDGLSIVMVALTSLMFFFAVLVSWSSITDRAGSYYAWLFVLQTAVIGAFVSFDIVLFYLFFELTLVPVFFLIGFWGVGGARRDAARKFFLYTLFGSLFTLVGIIGVVLANPMPLNPDSGKPMYNAPTQEATNPMNPLGPHRMPKPGPITFSIPQLIKNAYMWDTAHDESLKSANERVNVAGKNVVAERQKELDDVRTAVATRRTMIAWLFFALMAGLAVKIPIVPFHTWLPSAYSEAPLPVTMLLTAVLAKLGTYGILRIVIPIVPEAAVVYGLPVMGTLGAIGIVYAAFCAYAQRDLKLLAAYSSVSHLGFLVIGLFAMNREALSGSVLHMVNHGLSAGAMFALLVFLSQRYRTLDATQYGGLWGKYPRYTFFTIVICLAGVGMPGLNNFVSEMLMLAGLFDTRNLKLVGYSLAVVSAVGILLSSWYIFTMLRRVFFGPLQEPARVEAVTVPPGDIGGRELVPIAFMAALCLALGLYPQPILDVIQTDVSRVSQLANLARLRLDPKAENPADAIEDERQSKVTPTDAPAPRLPGFGAGPRGPVAPAR